MNSLRNGSHEYTEICLWKNLESIIIVGFPCRKYYINLFLCFLMEIFLTLATVFVNMLAIVAYSKSENLRKKPSCFLVMILSANDLAMGMFATSTSAIDVGSELLNNADCFTTFLNKLFLNLLAPISFSTLFALNVERYLSIIYPLFHKFKVTKTKLLLCLCFLWLLCIVISCMFFVQERLRYLLLCIGNIMGLTTLLGMYTRIFFTIRRRRKEMASLGSRRGRLHEKNFLQNVREAWSSLIVVICTITCFLPSGIEGITREKTYSALIQTRWNTMILLMASLLNSLVFFWRSKIWRIEAKKILCKKH